MEWTPVPLLSEIVRGERFQRALAEARHSSCFLCGLLRECTQMQVSSGCSWDARQEKEGQRSRGQGSKELQPTLPRVL
jgi:hypothetical protein